MINFIISITFLIIATSFSSLHALSNTSTCFIKHCSLSDEVLCWSSDTKHFNQYINTCELLHFEHQEYELRNNLVISDFENFTIVGNGAVINCENSEPLLMFAHISMLTVSNITFVSCGGKFTVLNISDISSLVLYNVTVAHVSNVILSNSNGYSVYTVDLQKATFIHVICHDYNGSGIMMVYFNVLTRIFTKYDVIRLSKIVMDHCTFYSTYPSITSRNSDKHDMYTMFVLVLKQKTGSVQISISNTHFVSNNRPSILISYFKYTQSKINILNCVFINNNNKSSNALITVTSNNVTPHDMPVSSHKLLMQNCRSVSPKTNYTIRYISIMGVNENITLTFTPLKSRRSSKGSWNMQISNKNKLNSSSFSVGEVHNLAIENVSKLRINGRKESLFEYTFDVEDDGTVAGNDNSICYCAGNNTNCSDHISTSERIYAGQSISIPLITFLNFNTSVYVASPEPMTDNLACEIGSSRQLHFIYQHCTNISYTIKSKFTGSKWCLLYLKSISEDDIIYTYNITLKDCPLGLLPNIKSGVCVCDPHLEAKGIRCDVNDGTFSTPGYTWISADKHMTKIMYTTECYLDYCLAHSTIGVHLNESQLQCANNRIGMMCGECAEGYSSVLGGSSCKKCSNIWLFLIAVCALAGILLVILLFMLNLTVVDGDIYGVLFCVNTLSIYTSRILPSQHPYMYLPIMLANLDIGVEVCFYDGMTSYHTMWLQLIFPFYVILIVIGLSFASRYVTFIEKLTRKRVIAVIATLYIFALNKMMLVTGKGLFAYRMIHFLHSNVHWSKLYWSIDSSIKLFGPQFNVLFACCLLIFIFILIPTFILFLFSKPLLRYHFVAKFLKPFLDAYQAPFKDNCYYFLGIEFILRVTVYACDSVRADYTAATYDVIILLYLVYLGYFQPFKSSLNGALYLICILILGCFTTLFLYFNPEKPQEYVIIFNILIWLIVLQMIGIILVHAWKYIFHQDLNSIHSKIFFLPSFLKFSRKFHIEAPDEVLPKSYEELREELLVFDPDN